MRENFETAAEMLKASVEAIRIAEVCCKNGQVAPVHISIAIKISVAEVLKGAIRAAKVYGKFR